MENIFETTSEHSKLLQKNCETLKIEKEWCYIDDRRVPHPQLKSNLESSSESPNWPSCQIKKVT